MLSGGLGVRGAVMAATTGSYRAYMYPMTAMLPLLEERAASAGLLPQVLCYSSNAATDRPETQPPHQLGQQYRWQQAGMAVATEKPLFSKILIANRGEIAIRVMRTARRLGIKTVAVYSTADRNALHVRYADEAVCIGPPPSAQSYLNIDAIMGAINQTGADCVHPGYGFLSENSHFAERLESEGVVFVGPPRGAIAAMGDKVESKRLAKAAGVSTIPGYIGEVNDEDHALQLAKEVGFPAMIKASAGGGGKGMRIVRSEGEVREGLRLCVQEAAASFGDSRMLIERYIEEPRHIEIQLLGDQHGTVLWLPERECSIQRRNQKVVEEAPSTFTTPELRRAMGEQAVALAKAVGYYSAGTLEFLVDKHRNFYFLEMNTRLQVEHPITEYITQLDLVEQMLRVAAGKKLDFDQQQASRVHGWAVECRLYAEDPSKGFLPSIGRLTSYVEPRGPGVRVDSGVCEGADISMYYDPMIGKLVAGGSTRDQALARMDRALDSYVVRGVSNNIQLLRAVVSHPSFVAGDTTTAFLQDHLPQVFETLQHPGGTSFNLPLSDEQHRTLLLLAAFEHAHRDAWQRGQSVPEMMASQAGHVLDLVVTSEGQQQPVRLRAMTAQKATVEDVAGGALEIEIDGRSHLVTLAVPYGGSGATPPSAPAVNLQPYCPSLIHASVDGELQIFQVMSRQPRGVTLQYAGAERQLTVQRPEITVLDQFMPPPAQQAHQNVLTSPMAGTLISVAVGDGDAVLPGDELAVVEAMKMRNVLKAAAAGRVKAVRCAPGDVLRADQVILELQD